MYEGIVENEKRRTLLAMVTAMDDAAEVKRMVIDSGGFHGGVATKQKKYAYSGDLEESSIFYSTDHKLFNKSSDRSSLVD